MCCEIWCLLRWTSVLVLLIAHALSEESEELTTSRHERHIDISGNERVMVYFGENGDFHRKLLLLSLRRRNLEGEDDLYSSTRNRDFDPFAIDALLDKDTTNRPLNTELFLELSMGTVKRSENATEPKKKEFKSEMCKELDMESSSCKGLEKNRNAIMRYCAADLSERCCKFLRDKREASDWETFRSCSCSRRLVCDLEPFLDLQETYRMCGIVLKNLPFC